MKAIEKESDTQVVIKFSAKDKRVWERVVDAAGDFCRKKDLYCGICIEWKRCVVHMTIATTTHPATVANKTHLAEVVKSVTEMLDGLQTPESFHRLAGLEPC